MIYEFEVEGDVVGKERPRVNMTTGHVYTPTKTKDYEYLVQQSFRIKYPNVKQISERVFVEIVAYMKIPKSTSKKQREEMLDNTISPTKKPDVDNIAKSILDAMNKFILVDDNQVSKIMVEKRYGEIPKVFVRIQTY